jgi:hypothetical protein
MINKSKNTKNNLRIILAIAWKDILDGWKNKVVLTSIITVLLLVLMYHFLPEMTHGTDLPTIVVLAPDTTIAETLTIEYPYNVEPVESMDDFLAILRDLETPGLGIVLNNSTSASSTPDEAETIAGYSLYWMKSEQVTSLKSALEQDLANILDRPVTIDTTGNIVYPLMDSYAYGKTFLAMEGLMIGIIMMGFSMAPQLIIEEKGTHTFQAVMVSPASLTQFVIGKTLAALFYTCLTTGISLLFVGQLVLHWGLMIGTLLLAMLVIILPGIFLGIIFNSKQQYAVWIWVVYLLALLPTFFAVVRILPEPLLNVVDWWPTVALSRLLRAGLTYQPPLSTFGWEALYMLVIVLIFFGLNVWIIQKKSLKGG